MSLKPAHTPSENIQDILSKLDIALKNKNLVTVFTLLNNHILPNIEAIGYSDIFSLVVAEAFGLQPKMTFDYLSDAISKHEDKDRHLGMLFDVIIPLTSELGIKYSNNPELIESGLSCLADGISICKDDSAQQQAVVSAYNSLSSLYAEENPEQAFNYLGKVIKEEDAGCELQNAAFTIFTPLASTLYKKNYKQVLNSLSTAIDCSEDGSAEQFLAELTYERVVAEFCKDENFGTVLNYFKREINSESQNGSRRQHAALKASIWLSTEQGKKEPEAVLSLLNDSISVAQEGSAVKKALITSFVTRANEYGTQNLTGASKYLNSAISDLIEDAALKSAASGLLLVFADRVSKNTPKFAAIYYDTVSEQSPRQDIADASSNRLHETVMRGIEKPTINPLIVAWVNQRGGNSGRS